MDKFVNKTPRNGDSTSDNNNNDENAKETSKRKFRSEWLQMFDWLQEKNGNSFCIVCDKSIFNHCTHLKNHEKTTLHLQNYKVKKNQINMEKFVDLEQRKLHENVRNAELTLVMFCITHNLPFLLMGYLPDLVAECCPDSSIAKLLKCGRTKSVQLTEFIGKQASEKTLSALRTNKFSLIVDETTDVSNKKCLVLVARYVDRSKIVHDRFLALLELTKADAVSIFNIIKNFFCKCNLPIKNLIGLATDGANVMSGDIGGLKALLKCETEIFYVKCTCHSLHLCCSYAFKKLPDCIEFLCRGVYCYFSHSPKRIAELSEFQEYCSVKPHKILGICQTRWLSLEGVISRLVEQWECLRLYFISCYSQVHGVKPAELVREMIPKVKAYFLFLTYILPIINNLNKEFQSESSRLPYLYSSIKTNFLLILSNFISQDKLKTGVDINYKDINNYKHISTIFIGLKAEIFMENNLSADEIVEIKSNVLLFYVEFLDQTKPRFDFNREDLMLLHIITPNKVLSEDNLTLIPLISKFQNLVDCDPDKIMTQWNLLRLSSTGLKSDMDINLFWREVSNIKNGLNEFCFSDLTNFVFNLLSLPHSSAAAERKFSEHSLIKTKHRNKLDFSTINNIMLCKEIIKKTDGHYVWSAKRDLN